MSRTMIKSHLREERLQNRRRGYKKLHNRMDAKKSGNGGPVRISPPEDDKSKQAVKTIGSEWASRILDRTVFPIVLDLIHKSFVFLFTSKTNAECTDYFIVGLRSWIKKNNVIVLFEAMKRTGMYDYDLDNGYKYTTFDLLFGTTILWYKGPIILIYKESEKQFDDPYMEIYAPKWVNTSKFVDEIYNHIGDCLNSINRYKLVAHTSGDTCTSDNIPLWDQMMRGCKIPFDNTKMIRTSTYDNIRHEVVKWLNSKEECAKLHIPWRLGIALVGLPGSGKSQLIKLLAQDLDLPLHTFDVGSMRNGEFISLWSDSACDAPCIYVIEDCDTIFNSREITANAAIGDSGCSDTVSFNTFINQIDGISSPEGLLIFLTTNHPERIDNALFSFVDGEGEITRPGRIDQIYEMNYISDADKLIVIQHFFGDDIPECIDMTTDCTLAQFINKCKSEKIKLIK